MASITVNTNGQTLTVNASISHWTSAALAVVASGDDDIPSTTTTTIGAAYTMHFANTATTVTVTVKQLDGTVLFAQELQCSPAVGPRTLNPVPSVTQVGGDLAARAGLPLAPTGALAETFPRNSLYVINTSVLTSARLHLTAINLPAGLTVTSASYFAATTAAVLPLNQWFALYNADLTLIGQTVDDEDTAWSANTVKTLAFASPVTTTRAGLHYLGIHVKATTAPTLHAATVTSLLMALPPIMNASSTTGLTDTAPAPAGALTAQVGIPYAYVS